MGDDQETVPDGGGQKEKSLPFEISGDRFVNLATGLWPRLLSRFLLALPPLESRINGLGESLVNEVLEPAHSIHAGIVSRSGGGLVGLLGGYCVLDEVEIHTFFLHPDCRSRGLGSVMFRQFLEACRIAGISTVHLEVRSRSPARNLYTRLGFEPVSIRKGYYGPQWSPDEQSDDAIVMVYTIAQMVGVANPRQRLIECLTGSPGGVDGRMG